MKRIFSGMFLMLFLTSMMLPFIVPVNAFYPCPSAELIQTILESPGELRVFDSEERITGLVNGRVVNEIPLSNYSDNTITVFSLRDSYRYEVVGTTQGPYILRISKVTAKENITFVAIDIPTSLGATHQYLIDWLALSEGQRGVTVKIDSEGDGLFEHNFTSDSQLDQSAYLSSFVDLNSDGTINILDITIVAAAYGSKPKNKNWNAIADLDKNGTINIVDITKVAKHYGKTV